MSNPGSQHARLDGVLQFWRWEPSGARPGNAEASSAGRAETATEAGPDEGAEEAAEMADEEATVPFKGNVADELVGAATARPKNSAPGATADQADSNLMMCKSVCGCVCVC